MSVGAVVFVVGRLMLMGLEIEDTDYSKMAVLAWPIRCDFQEATIRRRLGLYSNGGLILIYFVTGFCMAPGWFCFL